MKKLFLSMIVLATMFACTAPEKKAETTAANPEDTETGSFVSIDDKTAKFKELLEQKSIKKNRSSASKVFADF